MLTRKNFLSFITQKRHKKRRQIKAKSFTDVHTDMCEERRADVNADRSNIVRQVKYSKTGKI
jgi:hypothetical protein